MPPQEIPLMKDQGFGFGCRNFQPGGITKDVENYRLMKIYQILASVLILPLIPFAQQKKVNVPTPVKYQNVIVIIGDDHAAYALGCYGSKVARTPNLDALAGRGIRFERAYVNSPLCTPSRQSFLTGKLPHATGVTLLTSALSDTTYTIPEHLRKQGFMTGAIGKTHFNSNQHHGFNYMISAADYKEYIKGIPESIPASVQYRKTSNPWTDPATVFWNADGLPAAHYDEFDMGTFFANKAADYIERNKNNRFCLWVGFTEPHAPFNFPIEYANKYQPENMPLPTGTSADDPWVPLVFKNLSQNNRKGIIRSYYTSVEYLDKNVGIILNKLNSLGLDKNTLVIYLGDNGYLLNHHKRFEKHTMWEEAVRVPLIIGMGNNVQVSDSPSLISGLTEMVDLAPTILDALQVSSMPGLHGKSLLPVIYGKKRKIKDIVFSEYLVDNSAMVRTEKYKYVFTNGKRDRGLGYATGNPPAGVQKELYHLLNDPGETKNLAGRKEYRKIIADLELQMLDIFRRTHPKSSMVSKQLSIEDQLSFYCEPPEGERPDEK